MSPDDAYGEQLKRRLAATRKRVAAFNKANAKDKPKLLDRNRQERNPILGPPEKDQGLAFVEKYFAKEIDKPFKELGAITEVWRELAPDYAKTTAQLTGFKRGMLDLVVPSAAIKYKLEMDLRTGLEQRLRSAHRGETLKKVKVTVGSAAAGPAVAEDPEWADLRRVKLSEVMKAAQDGEL